MSAGSSTGEQASAVQHARAAIRTGGAAMASDQSSIVVSGAAALTTPGGTVLTSIHRTPGSRQHPEHDSTRTTLSVFLAAGLAAEGTGTASWPHMGMGGMDSSDQASPMAQAQGPAGQGVIGGSGAGRGGRGSSDRVRPWTRRRQHDLVLHGFAPCYCRAAGTCPVVRVLSSGDVCHVPFVLPHAGGLVV